MIKEVTKDILTNNKTSLTQIEAREIFDEIYQGLSDEVSTTSFITALKTVEKSEEILQAIIEASVDAVKKPSCVFENTFQTINLGYNKNNFDVYFALDIINSANNIKSIKYSTNNLNKNQIFRNFAVEIEEDYDEFLDKIEKTNFGYFYLKNSEKYIKYTQNIRNNLDFENIFDFVDNFLNPFSIKNCMIGTTSKESVEKLSKLVLLLKYENSLCLTSQTGLPFAVLEGENTIAESWKNKIFTYTLSSNLVDLPEFSIDKIKVENENESFEIIKNVFKGKIKDAFYYTIILNSALSLYISKNTNSLMDGINLAKKTIDSGLCEEKLNQIQIKR